jgi:hypothetical protein
MSSDRKHQIELIRSGKDEMNLIEHPFGSLSKERDTRSIELAWQSRHPETGKLVDASWTVNGHHELGLPTANDEKVYLVAMELTREAEWKQEIHFTLRDFLKRLGWSMNDEGYKRLHEAFARLSNVRIEAKNAFYHPQSRHYLNAGFGLIDTYVLAGEGPGRKSRQRLADPLTYFVWNKIIYESFLTGNVRTLDLDFALSLDRPLSMRLFRYLDMKRYDGKRKFEIGLRDLCEKHLGCVVEGRYDSQLKQTISPAHEELTKKGFLKSAAFEPMKTRKGLKCVYEFADGTSVSNDVELNPARETEQLQLILPDGLQPIFGSVESLPVGLANFDNESSHRIPQSGNLFEMDESVNQSPMNSLDEELVSRLVEQGITESVARDLCKQFEATQIENQLVYLSDRSPKNPAGALIKAIRGDWAPPQQYLNRIKLQKQQKEQQMELEAYEAQKATQKALERQETVLMEVENAQLDAMWAKLDETTRERIDIECRAKLGVLGNLGRGEAAMQAFRRAAMRDYLRTLDTEQ